MKLSDKSSTPKGAWLLIGTPGSGKTTFLTQCPGIYIFDLDNNMEGPRNTINQYGLSGEAEYDIPYLDTNGKLVPRTDRYVQLAAKVDAKLLDPKYPIIGIDGLTSLIPIMLDEVRRQQNKKLTEPIGGSVSITHKVDTDNLTLPEWGAFQTLLRHFIWTCKASGKLVIFTAHIMTDKDEMKGCLKSYISCPTSIKETLPGMFDEAIKLVKTEEGAPKKTVIKIHNIPAASEREEALGLKSSLWKSNGEILDFAKLKTLFA